MTSTFYKDGVNRMIDEGLEQVTKLMKYLKDNETRLSKMNRLDKKRTIKEEREDFITFSQVHPVVYEYIVTEGVFNRNAFKRYVRKVFGSPKSEEDQKLMAQDQKYIYYLKNKEYAVYYKYLLQETNSHLNTATLNQLYNEMVEQLDQSTKSMLDKYELAKKDLDIKTKELDEEKRKELLETLKSRLNL